MTAAAPVSPHSLEAERAVLGAVLLHDETLVEVAALVTPEDFFREAHRRIFRAMLALNGRRIAVDLTTIVEALRAAGDLDEAGGPAYLASLVDGMPRASHVAAHARIVREKARLRQLAAAGHAMIARAHEADGDATAILEQAEQAILGLADDGRDVGFESMRDIAPRALALLETMQAAKDGVTGVPTGFADLDAQTRGFQPGTLVVLGARPGLGKSSFATNVAQYAASKGYTVGMFTLEMPKEELFFRQIAATAQVDSHQLQSGHLADREWGRVSNAIGSISESAVHLDETPAIGIFAVRSRARRLKAEHNLALLIIDYLQLMGTSRQVETRALAISEITAALKALAKELKIPILVLSQLNRESVKGERPRRPQLSDLKESGSIEQDADIVLLLHKPREDEDVTEVIIAKHRAGPVGTIKLTWQERFMRFTNFSYQTEPVDARLPIGDR